MIWLLSQLRKLIIALHSKQSTVQLAAAVSMGMLLGFLPSGPLFYLSLAFLLILDLNIAMALLAMLVFSFIAPLFDVGFDALGFLLLQGFSVLMPIWTFLYNAPVLAYSGFNNTVVLGSFVVSLLLLYPIFRLSKWGIAKYRDAVTVFIEKHPFFAKLKRLKGVSWFIRLLSQG